MEDKIKGIALLLFGILLSWALPCVWQTKGQITAILSPASLLLAVWPVRVIIAVYKFVCRTGS